MQLLNRNLIIFIIRGYQNSFVYGFDDGLNNHTVLWYSDENYKAGYRLGSAHRR